MFDGNDSTSPTTSFCKQPKCQHLRKKARHLLGLEASKPARPPTPHKQFHILSKSLQPCWKLEPFAFAKANCSCRMGAKAQFHGLHMQKLGSWSMRHAAWPHNPLQTALLVLPCQASSLKQFSSDGFWKGREAQRQHFRKRSTIQKNQILNSTVTYLADHLSIDRNTKL